MVTEANTALAVIRASRTRYLVSWWPLWALAYVMSGVIVGVVTLIWLPVTMLFGVFVLTPVAIQPLVMLERRRLALMGGGVLPDPRRHAGRRGAVAWLQSRYSQATTWRELAYTVLHATVLLALDVAATLVAVVVPIVSFVGLVGLILEDGAFYLIIPAVLLPTSIAFLGVWVVAVVAIGHSEIARLLLGQGEEEVARAVTRSRARLVDAFEIERRRIERDLHDGAQQRLVALTITLGLAELERDHPEAAHGLVIQAGEQARSALAELRDLIRGIHPRVLTDLGLPAAVAELAEACGLPLTITLDLPDRPPSTAESTAYFVVAEALTNTVKHAKATRVSVSGAVLDQVLIIEIMDDGVGGADPAGGTGLAGLADRVDALGGNLTLSSPDGGPTTLRLELPCSA